MLGNQFGNGHITAACFAEHLKDPSVWHACLPSHHAPPSKSSDHGVPSHRLVPSALQVRRTLCISLRGTTPHPWHTTASRLPVMVGSTVAEILNNGFINFPHRIVSRRTDSSGKVSTLRGPPQGTGSCYIAPISSGKVSPTGCPGLGICPLNRPRELRKTSAHSMRSCPSEATPPSLTCQCHET